MKRILLILLLGTSQFTMAQYKNNIKEVADKAFGAGKFYEAAYYYKKVAEGLKIVGPGQIPYQPENGRSKGVKSPNREFIIYRLAESYRLYENYIEAEGWYYRLLNENPNNVYPLARLWYGVCLRANQRYDDALVQLTAFEQAYKGDSKYSQMASNEIANCKFAKDQYQHPAMLGVTKLKGQWNSDGSNYAINSTGTDYWFTSSRVVNNDKKRLNRIYYTAAYDNGKPVAANFNFADNKKDNEYGTVSFNSSGSKMYFTRWYKEGNKTVHIIYVADKAGNGWATPRKLNINVNADGFNAIQPFIAGHDKLLFFASNKPGGQGGYDIWVSNLDNEGNPLNSFNLGSTINTLSDEQSPWYDEDAQHLLFSSKGFTGLGGFDFFESYGNTNKWAKPVNMGFPFNSAKDDLYYMPSPNDKRKFFISSDRESDCCLDLFEVSNKSYTLAGAVTDCETQKQLIGAKISLLDSVTNQVVNKQTLTANVNRYSFEIRSKRPYILAIEKDGYFTKTVNVDYSIRKDTLISPDLCLQPLNIGKPTVLSNVLYDYGKSTLRSGSAATLKEIVKMLKDNPALKIELSSHTDSIGSDAYNLKLSQARAQACMDYIVSQGINNARVFAKGYGKSRPIALNTLPNGTDNPDGRQLNRRTEFTVLKTSLTSN